MKDQAIVLENWKKKMIADHKDCGGDAGCEKGYTCGNISTTAPAWTV